MTQDPIRDDIAFIRQALEDGREYVQLRSPDFAVWGALIALGYLGTYAHIAGLWALSPTLIWWPLVVLGWLFSLRGFMGRKPRQKSSPAGRSLRAVWFGFGISMLIFGLIKTMSPEEFRLMDVVTDCLLGACFFASAAISGVSWLRWVAAGWWLAAGVSLTLLDTALSNAANAGFMFLLLCVPGLVFWLRAAPAALDAHD